MKRLIETIPYTSHKWDEEAGRNIFSNIEVDVLQDESCDGALTLNFKVDGKCFKIIQNACPYHYKEQLTQYWMGLEDGYDKATNDL